MAELPRDPIGADLEDWVSAHFASRGCYVETSIKERSPDEILELDIVWTDYRKDPEQRHPVEVKSGAWGLSEVFKFYGWTRYLGLEPGQFIHKQPCEHDPASLKHVEARTNIALMHVAKLQNAEEQFKSFELPDPAVGWLPSLWRFSFWTRRRLVKSLNVAIATGVCPESAKAAKKYLTLVNDAVFFIPDMRDRIEKLLSTHFGHQQLGKSAGHEIETHQVEFENPPNTRTFARAWFDGHHFPVQACLYVEHRARLYIMKALVDFWLAKGRGRVPDRRKNVILSGGKILASQPVGITNAMEKGLTKLSAGKHFRLFPVFWQTLLWSWGGFLLNDHVDEEFAQLEKETGVPKDEIPLALEAFDEIFPIKGGWFRNVDGGRCRVLILMPAVVRGLGAHRRRVGKGVPEFKDLPYAESTKVAMAKDNNALANLLDCAERELFR